MSDNPRQDLFLKISKNLVDEELRDLRNYVSGAKILAAGFVQKANAHRIFIQMEKEGKLKTGDLSLLANLLRKIGRQDYAERAEKVAEKERKGQKTRKRSATSVSSSDQEEPRKRRKQPPAAGAKERQRTRKRSADSVSSSDLEEPRKRRKQPPAARAKQVDVRRYFDKVVRGASANWDDLARKLKFEENEIDGIQELKRDNDSRCKEMLKRWRNREGKAATLQALKKALTKIGHRLTAESLEAATGCDRPSKILEMSDNPRQDLYLKISRNLIDEELRDLRNYVSGAGIIPAGFVQSANAHQIFTQLEKEGKLKPGDLSLLADLLTKIGRQDYAEMAEKIAEDERKGQNTSQMPAASVSSSPEQEEPTQQGKQPPGTKQGVRKYFFFVKERVSSDWKDLAFHLGFEQPDIDNIDGRNRDDKSRCMDLLEEWLKRNGEKPTIEVLMEALSEANLQSVVDGLKGIHLGAAMDSPVKLTSTQVVNDRREVSITPEAEEILSSLPPRPVDVVSVVGPMRKGKSHLGNLLCKRKSGFQLGSELVSETKDFWFWIGPHPVQFDRYIMVIDTEGLGDYADEGQNEKDLKYLVLATLFSNHLVFNLQGNLDQTFLSQLRIMGDLSEHIRVQKDGGDEENDLGEHFPTLWVAVQNTHLDPPQGLSPDEYLEVVLERKKGHTKAIRAHNEMTDAVKDFFPKRHLRLIPPPTADRDTLRNLDKVNDDVLQTEYGDAVNNFTREIWNSGLVKTVNGAELTTTGLLNIMRYYASAINAPKAMPSVLGAYEAMVEGGCRRAVDERVRQFLETVENTVKSSMPTDQEDCDQRIRTAAEDAISKLCEDVGKWDKTGTWKKRLQDELEKERLSLLQLNSSKAKEKEAREEAERAQAEAKRLATEAEINKTIESISYGGSGKVNIAGRTISYSTKSGFYIWELVFNGTAHDVATNITGKSGNRHSQRGAAEHAVKDVFRQLMANNII
ncbi:Guanylate-binding protein 6 [Branchiostoma belcheri]|nr:Guanylate-binding protein 6 [Branchiostoma belcheri]